MADTSRNERDYLTDMLLYTRQTRKFAEALNFNREKFDSSFLHQYAIILCIAFIGEAASGIPSSTKNSLPHIRWDDIIGMRHRLIHGYYKIDLDVVWGVVINHLPPLIDALESLVPPESTPTQ